MAKFEGFQCDGCGKPFPNAEKNKTTIRYEGPLIEGEYTEERCPECLPQVPEGVSLKPLRRRRVEKGSEAPAQRESEGQVPEPVHA